MEPAPSPDPLASQPQYQKIKDLGIGSFGSVALYQRHEGRGEPALCAVKFMPSSGPGVDLNLIHREVQSHRVLRHPHVIRFKQLGITPSHIYMTMEFADQGDLLGFLRRKGPLPEADSRWLFQQIIFGLDYCHLKGVVNRDLKPENLLLKLTPEASKRHRRHLQQQLQQQQSAQHGSHGGSPAVASPVAAAAPSVAAVALSDYRTSNAFNLHIKIADFGLSKRGANSLPKTRVGTISYMAPEVLLAGPTQRYDGQQADIWSAGVVLYAMLFSRVPFEPHEQQAARAAAQANVAANGGDAVAGGSPADRGRGDRGGDRGGARDRAATIQRILAGQWSVPPGMSVSRECYHLLSQMLVPDPAQRISMQGIMQHPWFRAGLPPAALTMNTQLVKQQDAQGPAAGEQPETEIDAILDELRRRNEAEAGPAAISASVASDDASEERRLYEVGAYVEQAAETVARSPPAVARGPEVGDGGARAGLAIRAPAKGVPAAGGIAGPPAGPPPAATSLSEDAPAQASPRVHAAMAPAVGTLAGVTAAGVPEQVSSEATQVGPASGPVSHVALDTPPGTPAGLPLQLPGDRAAGHGAAGLGVVWGADRATASSEPSSNTSSPKGAAAAAPARPGGPGGQGTAGSSPAAAPAMPPQQQPAAAPVAAPASKRGFFARLAGLAMDDWADRGKAKA